MRGAGGGGGLSDKQDDDRTKTPNKPEMHAACVLHTAINYISETNSM